MVDKCQLECPGDSEHCVAGDVEYCSCDTGSVLLEGLCVQSESKCQVCLYHCVIVAMNSNFTCKFNTPSKVCPDLDNIFILSAKIIQE